MQFPLPEHMHDVLGWDEPVEVHILFLHGVDDLDQWLFDASGDELPTNLNIFVWMVGDELFQGELIGLLDKHKDVAIREHLVQLGDISIDMMWLNLSIDWQLLVDFMDVADGELLDIDNELSTAFHRQIHPVFRFVYLSVFYGSELVVYFMLNYYWLVYYFPQIWIFVGFWVERFWHDGVFVIRMQ